MQNIRRATKKHRKILLLVVVFLMLGLVASFASFGSNSPSRSGGGADVGGELTLEQQITAYEDYITTQEAAVNSYDGYLILASSYLTLSSLYVSKYSTDMENVPTVDPLEYDEDGNEIPLDAEQEAARAAAEAERDAAVAAAELWLASGKDAAVKAESYYQQALDNAPADLDDIGVSDIKYSQAQARDLQGDTEGALAFIKEAYALAPDNLSYLLAIAALEKALGNLEEALARYEQASAIYPENASFISQQASILASLDNTEKARELFLKARGMSPMDYTIAYDYASFIAYTESYEVAVAELTAYRDSLPEDSPSIASAEQAISYFQAIADMIAGMNFNIETQEGDDDQGAEPTEGSDGAESDAETGEEEADDGASEKIVQH